MKVMKRPPDLREGVSMATPYTEPECIGNDTVYMQNDHAATCAQFHRLTCLNLVGDLTVMILKSVIKLAVQFMCHCLRLSSIIMLISLLSRRSVDRCFTSC